MRHIIILLLSFIATTAIAQQSRKEIKDNVQLSGSNYLAYPEPQKKLSPAPEGYVPYYISHYGRHGSRNHINPEYYTYAPDVFAKALKAGKLTPLGEETMRKGIILRDDARKREGELTLLGAEQHQQIAQRMYDRFPEVFAGKTRIDAKSSIVIRCILSMENALQVLRVNNPQLDIRHDASEHDMWYLVYKDDYFEKGKKEAEKKPQYKEFVKRHSHPERLMKTLFNDQQYIKDSINSQRLMDNLWKIATNIQSTELRHDITYYSLFTDDEIYDQWLKDNAWWYTTYAASPLNGSIQQYTQKNLLSMMIHEADSCLKLPHPGASLRYGHEVCVMPLVVLLELNNYGDVIDDLEQLDDCGWLNYRIFPMACNVQIVFYKPVSTPEGTAPAEGDILLKVLLNEEEATLPLTPVSGAYYRWTDFQKYFTDKLANFKR